MDPRRRQRRLPHRRRRSAAPHSSPGPTRSSRVWPGLHRQGARQRRGRGPASTPACRRDWSSSVIRCPRWSAGPRSPSRAAVDGVTVRVGRRRGRRARLHCGELRGLRDLRDAGRGARRPLRRDGRVLSTDPAASIVVAHGDEPRLRRRWPTRATGWPACSGSAPCPPPARGGLGALVTVAPTNLTFEHGASSCSLQASPMGESVYRRLGYETMYHYAEYVRWPKPPALSAPTRPTAPVSGRAYSVAEQPRT